MASGVSFFTRIKDPHHPYWSCVEKSVFHDGKIARAIDCKCKIEGSQGVEIGYKNEAWYINAIRIMGLLFSGYFAYKIAQKTPSQIFHSHKFAVLMIAPLPLLFAAKVYYRLTTTFHVCPPVEEPKLPADMIPEKVRTHLLGIVSGYVNSIDELPVFKGDAAPKFEQMTETVMIGAINLPQCGRIPYIAIKTQTSDKTQSGVIFLYPNNSEDLTQWIQLKDPKIPQLYDPTQDVSALHLFMMNGRHEHDRVEWIIPGHSKLKIKKSNEKKVHKDKIAEPVCVLLNELLGKKGSVETLPVLERFQDLVPKPKEVDQPIMKYYGTGFGAPAAVVFKLRHRSNNRLLVLAQASEDAPNVWKQLKPESSDIFPDFFDQLTDEKGQLDMNALDSFHKLKMLILNGSGKDAKGRSWELVTK